MCDPILGEIWRVRDKPIREHGGFEGDFQCVQKLDRARLRKAKLRRDRKTTKINSK